MKKSFLFLSLLFMIPAVHAEKIGVPSECEDVMLQAFYWDSYKTQSGTDSKYGRTKWMDLMKDTAVINANFDLVWFPPSAQGGGVGYYHKRLSNQDSDWGTKNTLTNLIKALHAGGTKVLADIVINHRGNKNSWTDFYADNFGEGYNHWNDSLGAWESWQLTQEHICSNDEAFTDKTSSAYQSDVHGAKDTGTNDGGCRDLDHTSPYVQEWAKSYVRWMLEKMNYDGFRYDMTLGYHGKYLKMYNEAANPYLSVSELWESISRQKQHLQETDSNTMIFDFQQKYELHKAIVNGNYSKLMKNSNSFRGQGLEKYAVTFIDNHDTFERDSYGSNQYGGQFCDLTNATVKANIVQAYAYTLTMPGVPCVFWPHWKSYMSEINRFIAIRKAAGIHSESKVTDESYTGYAYTGTITGHKCKVVLRLGKNRDKTRPEGFYLVADGDHYTIFSEIEMPQGIEEVVEDSKAKGEKFFKDGQLLIKRGGHVFDVTGRIVE